MIRNLLHVIRHFKAAFILNLIGLSVAFTAFMMLMMQVRHDLTFDRCYDDADCIVRLDVVAAAFAGVAALTAQTVVWKSRRVAGGNPMKNLKSE